MADFVPMDIAAQLLEAASRRTSWSIERASDLARTVAALVPGAEVDWDDDSGEEWARILVDRFVIALVRAQLPLVIVVRGEVGRLRALGSGVVVVIVDDMDTPRLSCRSDVISQVFPEREVSPTLEPEAFSALDLWFATT